MRNDPGTTTHTKQLTHSRLETPLPRVAPYLPLLAAVLLFVGSWLTWVTVRFAFVIDGAAQGAFDMPILGWSGLLELIDQTPFIALARVSLFIWDVFPLTGIVLGLILLQRQRGSRTLLVLYGGWLLITTPVVALILVRALTLTSPIPCAPGDPVCPETRMLSRGIEPGGWLTIAALALGWLALGLLVQRQRVLAVTRASGNASQATPRYRPAHRLGAIVFTLGAAIWAFGLLAVPWATSGCTGLHLSLNHFARGTCSGVDGYDVLGSGLSAIHQNSVTSWPLIEVAGIVGLYVAITVWFPRLSRQTWVTAIGWSLFTTLLFAVGAIGVRATIAFPPVFTSDPQDPWMGSFGVAICALGVMACWVGIALLARAEILQARR